MRLFFLLGAMPKPRKSKDEKDLEKLAKKLLSMPHKPREESKLGRKPATERAFTHARKRAKKATSR